MRARLLALAAVAALALPARSHAAAQIVLLLGAGFDDATPATPVGDNPGTTVGQQRRNAFQRAADIWAANLDSGVPIEIQAEFTALACDASTAVLGSAGPVTVSKNFPHAPLADTWYVAALANKLAGVDLKPKTPDISANFNANLGQTGCLDGSFWYYGLDANEPAGQLNLMTTLLHEFGHGLGFLSLVNDKNGGLFKGSSDAYTHFLFDDTLGRSWESLRAKDRKASVTNPRNVVWVGRAVTAAVPGVLAAGTPFLFATAPASVAGQYAVGTASFGPAISEPGVAGELVAAQDAADATGPSATDACTTITNAAALKDKIALVDRGACTFVTKALNVQAAGAIGMVVVDNTPAEPPSSLGGTDDTIKITAVRVTLAVGSALRAALPAQVRIALDPAQRAGADAAGRALVYTPNPVEPGSSVSHWDTIAFPNQLMEPFDNGDEQLEVAPPFDLTRPAFDDLGW